MKSTLDWSRFKTGRIGPEKAFEAFTAQLYDRWLRREYPVGLTSYVVHGAGGDGGVEAFGRLENGDVMGFQAKWFDGPLNDSRIRQIRSSVHRARKTFPSLRRYVVALPQNLTKARNDDERGGVERWDELIAALTGLYPDLTIIRWDEAGLLEQIAHVKNHELKALWFGGEFTFNAVQLAWEKSRQRLLNRYLPDLHAVGRIEQILDADRWSSVWRARTTEALLSSAELLQRAASDIDGFIRLTEGRRTQELDDVVGRACHTISELQIHAQILGDVLASGPKRQFATFPHSDALDRLVALLRRFKEEPDGIYTADHAQRAVKAALEARDALVQADEAIRDSSRPRVVVGPAGCGKTHALTDMVHRLVKDAQPAVLVLAKDTDPAQGAARLLGETLDLPGWPLGRILDGLEALAMLHQISMEQTAANTGFSRALILIDGLEELSASFQWPNVLGDLAVELEQRPRVHLVATVRPELLEHVQMPGTLGCFYLEEHGGIDLPKMLREYCKAFKVKIDAVPWIGWALRTPLEVRLLAEEFQGKGITAEEGTNANILTLFRRKLNRIETEARQRAGTGAWSPNLGLITVVLKALSDLTADVGSGRIGDLALVKCVGNKDPEFTAARVRFAITILIEHGLIDRWFPPADGLFNPEPEYELATRHLSDFLISLRAIETVVGSVHSGQAITFPEALSRRSAAAVLFAAQLADRGYFLTDLSWHTPPRDLETLHASSLALIPPSVAGQRADEISAMLTKTTALNRGILRGLVLPVARIPGHPLGPRLLDQSLRHVSLIVRDPIWSVPEDLDGVGPWQACFNDVLEHIQLSAEVDVWDGLPLVLAWACSSVVEKRRRQARERLAVWGARNLDQILRLLDHMASIDDPQVIDDIVVAAFGSAIGASVGDSALKTLARLVDELFFQDSPRAWTPSVVVRAAARGIIERAALLFPNELDNELVRARPPYKPRNGEWPAMDPDEVATTSHFGGPIVTGDLSWYVAERCFAPFSRTAAAPLRKVHSDDQFDYRLQKALHDEGLEDPHKVSADGQGIESPQEQSKAHDTEVVERLRDWYKDRVKDGAPEDMSEVALMQWALSQPELKARLAEHEQEEPAYSDRFKALLRHAVCETGIAKPTPVGIRNGMIAHLVRAWGWSEKIFSHYAWDKPSEVVDDAIAKRHGSGASHGTRSAVCSFREKYVWAAVDRIAGELADRLPVWSDSAWVYLRNFGGLGNGMADPLPHFLDNEGEETAVTEAWEPRGILAEQFREEHNLVLRAEHWLLEGRPPDPQSLIRGRVENWSDAAILSFSHFRRGHQTCIDQLIQVRAFGMKPTDVALIRRDAPHVCRDLYEAAAWTDEGTYISPAIACWAPWLTWHGLDYGYNSKDANGQVHHVLVRPTVSSFTSRFEGDWPREPKVLMPSPSLCRALGVIGMRGGRWLRSYIGRDGSAVAIERDIPQESFSFHHHYLAMEFASLVDVLGAEGLTSAWAVRVLWEVTPALFMRGHSFERPADMKHKRRDSSWLVIGNPLVAMPEVIPVYDVLEPYGD